MTIDFEKTGGLVPAIAQDADTGQVLMLAWMNRDAYDETVRTGRAVYFSRSRNRLWRKGEESGNVQEVREIYLDCDADTILLKVHQIGGASVAYLAGVLRIGFGSYFEAFMLAGLLCIAAALMVLFIGAGRRPVAEPAAAKAYS